MAGRPPKPLALHRLHGNVSHLSNDKLNGVDNPAPPQGVPERPKGMPKGANRIWRITVRDLQLHCPGVLAVIDGRVLGDYCVACWMCEEAIRSIRKHGQVFVTHFEDKQGNLIVGDIKQNPSCAVLATNMKIKAAIAQRFGLDPASRSKIKIPPQEKVDPVEAFLNGAGADVVHAPAGIDPKDMGAGDDLN